MSHGKTMKFIVFLDPSSVIFLWQYKLINNKFSYLIKPCILSYLEIDLDLEIPSIKRNNRLNNRLFVFYAVFPTWNPKTRPRAAKAANILPFHLRGLQGSHIKQ